MTEMAGDNANGLEALDITLAVLSQISSPRDLLAAGKVNHSFNRAVRENFLWQTVQARPRFLVSLHRRPFLPCWCVLRPAALPHSAILIDSRSASPASGEALPPSHLARHTASPMQTCD